MVGTVAVIGAGVIGGAIVKCLQESEDVGKVIATRRSHHRQQGGGEEG
jgi:pyrroline-5-carboxylate reductase